ncbi:hypothetical protein CWE13_02260 [Aliidiomarina shirensis]|uniref:Uncharacterized protein n=1 Tax=Aliidiomarina shirensis TaxID=1048642 RepID=A0A432WXH6_9GAMM|nr:hypothetical protein [Aliidiomarina shirensis]RUO38484.1 hypothetical protein CWE13_02260 [Aliidiomarina shirensis]
MGFIKKVFSALWRSAVTLIVTLFAYVFIAFGYESMQNDKARLESFAYLEQLYDSYMVNPRDHAADLSIRYVNLNDEYYIHDENTDTEHYSFTFNYTDDSRYTTPREVYSYEIPENFQQRAIYTLTEQPTIYALSPAAQFSYEESKASGWGFFVFIFILIAFPWLSFVVWLWRRHGINHSGP